MSTSTREWGIAVFANRESLSTICATLEATALAAGSRARIDVLVNGNPQLVAELTAYLGSRPTAFEKAALRIWSIPLGDKANAWSQYVQRIWSGEDVAFFVDGYARPNADAIELLGTAMMRDDTVQGGTGLPSMGRSAAALRKEFAEDGGFHGNLCGMKGSFLARMRACGFAIPRGLYRTDSLMGAVLSYDLDPAINLWDEGRILVHTDVTWQTEHKHWWRWRDVKAHFKRMVRQARGEIEKRAIRDHLTFRRQRPETLLPTAHALILDWAQRCPDDYRAQMNCNPLAWLAMRQLRREASLPQLATEPELAMEHP